MYEVSFLSSKNYAEFWQMLGGLLRFISPFLMIGVALIIAGWLFSMIIISFRKALGREKDNEGYQRDLDNEDNREIYKQKYKY